MKRLIAISGLLVLGSLPLAAPAAGQAYTFNVNGLIGAGGSFEDEGDSGFGNLNWQLGFSNNIDEKTHFGVRLGGLDWSSGDRVGDLASPSLLYATLAGEYRETSGSFSGSFIEAGVYLGLGYYRLDGTSSEGMDESENGVGFVVGLTGDLPLNKRRNLAMRIELSGHYVDLGATNLLGFAQLGLAYRF